MADFNDTTINDSGFLVIPSGTTAQRPTPATQGDFRYNTEDEVFEVYDGTDWVQIGGAGGGAGDPANTATIDAYASMVDIAYAPIPNGPRTVLNYVSSFGINENGSNNGAEPWNSGFDNVTFTNVSTGQYFLNGRWLLFSGDGSADGADWALWNFGPAGGGDFNPDATASGSAFFGGEFVDQSGATNGGVASTGYIWGFDGSDYVLLWQEPLGGGGNWGKSNANWYASGNTVSSGNGKRSEYDSLSITHIAFSVS